MIHLMMTNSSIDQKNQLISFVIQQDLEKRSVHLHHIHLCIICIRCTAFTLSDISEVRISFTAAWKNNIFVPRGSDCSPTFLSHCREYSTNRQFRL